ncbi:gamma-butyrobetaine dioxygenase-like [Corticium candelabrum]|uniref:gamma-butyrobetaine dioxygenase-like n=1 Tax=Corticium candelabrum TaxID=121492 RepID=UPI002E2FC18F|nr:gamma-butyrobetaine dioxygenase-like [Corticium candelabrum]
MIPLRRLLSPRSLTSLYQRFCARTQASLTCLHNEPSLPSQLGAPNCRSFLYTPTCRKSTNVKVKEVEISLEEALPLSQDSMKLIWNDGSDHIFNYLWLRDNCKCSLCVDRKSKQKLLDTPAIPLNLMPEVFEINQEDNSLNVTWPASQQSGERHFSQYDSNWLHRHGCRVSDQYFHPHKHTDVSSPIHLWNRDIIEKHLPTIEYRDVMGSDEGLFRWLSGLYGYGVALIKNAPVEEETVLSVGQRISYVKETNYGVLFDVVALPQNAEHLAYTGDGLPHHTDLNYKEKSPGVQILHCLHSSGAEPEEGLSLFVDGFYVAESLRKQNYAAFQVLSSVPVEFKVAYKENTYKHHVQIICLDNSGHMEEIHINNRTMGPLHAPLHLVKLFYSAYKSLTNKIREESSELKFQLQQGDVVAFNNRRVLHGRTGYNPRTVHRHLQGCYIEYDEFLSKLQSLENRSLSIHSTTGVSNSDSILYP